MSEDFILLHLYIKLYKAANIIHGIKHRLRHIEENMYEKETLLQMLTIIQQGDIDGGGLYSMMCDTFRMRPNLLAGVEIQRDLTNVTGNQMTIAQLEDHMYIVMNALQKLLLDMERNIDVIPSFDIL